MVRLLKSQLALAALIIAAGLFLSSFSTAPAGGEGFEIYLDKKLVMQRFGNQLKSVQELKLENANAQSELMIKYHHCGKVGKNRVIALKNGQNKTIREWRFENNAQPVSPMICKVSEIINAGKASSQKLILYYTSTEVPDGRTLATVSIGGTMAARK